MKIIIIYNQPIYGLNSKNLIDIPGIFIIFSAYTIQSYIGFLKLLLLTINYFPIELTFPSSISSNGILYYDKSTTIITVNDNLLYILYNT